MTVKYVDYQKVQEGVSLILKGLGYDADNQHLSETPRRVAEWFAPFAKGEPNAMKELTNTLNVAFDEIYQGLVLERNIPFVAICSHHLLPFTGVGHIGYIPKGRVVGISKLARALHVVATRLTLQEQITEVLTQGLWQILEPKGLIVVLEAEHECMTCRGVKAIGSSLVTCGLRGVFRDSAAARAEVLSFINNRGALNK